MAERQLQHLWIHNPARGVGAHLTPRALDPNGTGPLWRYCDNWQIVDGYLSIRPPLVELDDVSVPGIALPTIDLNTAFPYPANNWGNSQTPVVLQTINEGEFVLCVTSREIFWYIQSSDTWVNLTPVYSTGTVDVTNGSTTVIGNATYWSTRKITRAQLFIGPDSTVYQIASVGADDGSGNSSITLTSAYAGATQSAQAYTVRRTFNGVDRASLSNWNETFLPIFAKVFNGDLFVSGPVGGGDMNSAEHIPAVIKVTDVFNSAVANTDADYICSREALTATVDTKSEWDSIWGMVALEDGRIMVAVRTDDGGSTTSNRVYFCSHLDHTEWTNSPAGFTDRVELEGRLTGLARWGADVIALSEVDLSLGRLTGLDDPPVTYRRLEGSHIGCVGPMTIKELPIGLCYVGVGPQMALFNGARPVRVGHGIKNILRNTGSEAFTAATAAVEPHESQYRLMLGTDVWVWHYETGDWVREIYTDIVGAMAHPGTMDIDVSPPALGIKVHQHGIAGLPSYNKTDSVATDMLFMIHALTIELTLADLPDNRSYEDAKLISGALDAGLPGVGKSWRRAVIWLVNYAGFGNTTDLTVYMRPSFEQGDLGTWTRSATVTLPAVGGDPLDWSSQEIAFFDFEPIQSEAVQIKIEMLAADAAERPYLIEKIRLDYAIDEPDIGMTYA